MQWSSVVRSLTTTIAARRKRVATARAAPQSERWPAQWRARAFATRKPAVCSGLQQKRRSTVCTE